MSTYTEEKMGNTTIKNRVVHKLKGKKIKSQKEIIDEYRLQLREALMNKTNCLIQHTGWCCGTCFFAIDDKKELENRDWQTILWLRGDSKVSELDNLPEPKEREKILKNILRLCRK